MILQSELTKQQNGFKITLKTLEDNLLSRLSSASGNFLGETALVENLEITKQTAAEGEKKVRPGSLGWGGWGRAEALLLVPESTVQGQMSE